MIEEILEQIAHNEMLIEKYTDQATIDSFNQLTEEQHYQWIMDAQREKIDNGDTAACKQCYIGKIALVHLYEARKEHETIQKL